MKMAAESFYEVESTFPGNTNNGVSVKLHIEKVKDFLHVVQLFLAANMGRLSQQGTKLQCLSHSRSRQMHILLLDIAGFPLKRIVPRLAIYQNFTGNDSHSHARGEDI